MTAREKIIEAMYQAAMNCSPPWTPDRQIETAFDAIPPALLLDFLVETSRLQKAEKVRVSGKPFAFDAKALEPVYRWILR